MIKNNGLKEEDVLDPEELKTSQNLKPGHSRHKSYNGFVKTFKSHETEKPKGASKGKFRMMKTLFKINKNKKKDIVKKIDKFADEKLSHMVNLKKLKQRDPFTETLDIAQPRSLSRTFTGNMNSVGSGSLLKLSDALNISSPNCLGSSDSPKEESPKIDFNLINETDSQEEENKEYDLERSIS